jgi:predicted nucleotide-binding protein
MLGITPEEADRVLGALLDEAQSLSSHYRDSIFKENLQQWTKRAEATLRAWGLSDEARRLANAQARRSVGIDEATYLYEIMQARQNVLTAVRRDIVAHPDFYIEQRKPIRVEPTALPARSSAKSNKVFLGHGRNLLWTKVERWLEKDKNILVEAWESTSHSGEHVVQVLETLLNSCTFAVLVVTGEDATPTGGLRACQSVVHEVGLFQGKLGFKKVALLKQEGTDGFSNIDGLQNIPFPADRIEAAFPELERAMKREGLI